MNHATTLLLAALCALASACSTPTLQQRQDAWRKVRDVTRAQCLVGNAGNAYLANGRNGKPGMLSILSGLGCT